jgi:rod shape-determining protein MreC
MIWKGHDIQYGSLEELPRHAVFKKGDIIVTSGYSAIFPPGIVVGRIRNEKKNLDSNFYSLDVKLATNFATLKNVRIISNYRQTEQRSSEKEAEQND